MTQKTRIIIAITLLVVIVGLILGVDALQRRIVASQAPAGMPPGSIPIFVDEQYVASFTPDDLTKLELVSFVDDEEGKTQEGWLLRDVLLLYLEQTSLEAASDVTVSSSSRGKEVQFVWEQVVDLENIVMFDLSGRGTLKLVSKLPSFDTRADWVQDVDKIEVQLP